MRCCSIVEEPLGRAALRFFTESIDLKRHQDYLMNMATIEEAQNELLDELSLFQDWTERYEYVISLGKKLPEMDPAYQTDLNLIKGCQSQVWLEASVEGDHIIYHADSDSLITKGMIALFIRVLSDQSADDILTANMDFVEKTGLKEHLAPTRANALSLMANQMKQKALFLSKK